MKNILIFTFIGICLLPSSAYTKWQTPKRNKIAAQLFDAGVQDYKAKRYTVAHDKFKKLVNEFDLHSLTTAAQLMYAKSLYKTGRYRETIRVGESFLREFSYSDYADDMLYLMGQNDYQLGNEKKAAAQVLQVISISSDSGLRKKAWDFARQIMDKRLSIEELTELYNTVHGTEPKAILTIKTAERQIQSGSPRRAAELLEKFIERNPTSLYKTQAENLLAEAKRTKSSIKAGILLPLSGYMDESAQQILKGMKFAQEQHNKYQKDKIFLEIKDTEGDMIRTIKCVEDLARNDDILAILGPLQSDLSIAAGVAANYSQIPLITPTATEQGIASIGDYIFQAKADIAIRGKAMAHYAIKDLAYQSFAILAPADIYGQTAGDNFAAEVDKLGGTIVSYEWYQEGEIDFKHQFERIRQLGFRKMYVDSLFILYPDEAATFTPLFIDSLYSEEQKINAEYNEENNIEIDSIDIPVTSIDAFYFPLYEEDIRTIAPQFAHYNFTAGILGGGNWASPDELREQQNYTDGAIFTSDHFINDSDREARKFIDLYRVKYKTTPDLLEAYGYDTMNLLLNSIKKGNTTRQSIRKALEQTVMFQGVHNTIRFQPGSRVNSSVLILQYKDGSIIKLKDEIINY